MTKQESEQEAVLNGTLLEPKFHRRRQPMFTALVLTCCKNWDNGWLFDSLFDSFP